MAAFTNTFLKLEPVTDNEKGTNIRLNSCISIS